MSLTWKHFRLQTLGRMVGDVSDPSPQFSAFIDNENVPGFQIMVGGDCATNFPVQIGNAGNKGVNGAI